MGVGIGGSHTISQDRSKGRQTSHARPPVWAKEQILAYMKDINRLRQPSPYSGTNLGYDKGTLDMMPGERMDLAAGARRGASEAITDRYSQPGAPGAGSYAALAAQSGLDSEYAATAASEARRVAISDAQQRRVDYYKILEEGRNAGQLGVPYARQTTRTSGKSFSRSHTGSVSYGSGGSAPATTGTSPGS